MVQGHLLVPSTTDHQPLAYGTPLVSGPATKSKSFFGTEVLFFSRLILATEEPLVYPNTIGTPLYTIKPAEIPAPA